uniref:Uncharacterized protein n=1 Tax=Arundo donax TaxID=35708 RepID=A0A0A8XQ83_ARUDO
MDKGPVAVAPAPAGSSSAAGKKAKRFDIKKWNAVSLWAWGADRNPAYPSLPQSLLPSSVEFVRSDVISFVILRARRHRGGQLRHLPQPHHGPLHRVPGEPG